MYLTVYMKPMLTRLLKILNNVKLCAPLNTKTLNHDMNDEMDRILVKKVLSSLIIC
jgi:hypothetical protein